MTELLLRSINHLKVSDLFYFNMGLINIIGYKRFWDNFRKYGFWDGRNREIYVL